MFTQVQLPYGFDALEPVIDALTVETHYTKHHAAYTKKLNELADKAGLQNRTIESILAGINDNGQLDDATATGLRNNGGGFYNHNLYFSQLSPEGGGVPGGKLAQAISQAFGSFDAFKAEISDAAVAQFGSGYAWLNTDADGVLSISQSPNQDNPPLETGGALHPLFCIDVWEHAYYLQYKNLRAEYVNRFFGIVNWQQVEQRYAKALAGGPAL